LKPSDDTDSFGNRLVAATAATATATATAKEEV